MDHSGDSVRETPATRAGTKRVLVVLAGAFDPPGDATPLCDAEKPALDRMARSGRAGIVALGARSPWDGFTALLGLGDAAPSLGACEALGAGVEVGPSGVAYRADFITVADGVVRDPFGGRVKDPEASLLVEALAAAIPGVRIVRAGGHRNLVVLPAPAHFCPSPWEMVGQRPAAGLPPEGQAREFYEAAARVLAAHDVNAVRVDLAENPANALWLHGAGAAGRVRTDAAAPPGGAVLVGRGAATAGLARVMGWQCVDVEGDDEALAAAALAAIATADLVVVRTESVLDAASLGGRDAKRDALSRADARMVAPLLAAVEERDAFVMAVAGDSVFDASHALVRRPVPFVVAGTAAGAVAGTAAAVGDSRFTEKTCDIGGYRMNCGAEFFALFA